MASPRRVTEFAPGGPERPLSMRRAILKRSVCRFAGVAASIAFWIQIRATAVRIPPARARCSSGYRSYSPALHEGPRHRRAGIPRVRARLRTGTPWPRRGRRRSRRRRTGGTADRLRRSGSRARTGRWRRCRRPPRVLDPTGHERRGAHTRHRRERRRQRRILPALRRGRYRTRRPGFVGRDGVRRDARWSARVARNGSARTRDGARGHEARRRVLPACRCGWNRDAHGGRANRQRVRAARGVAQRSRRRRGDRPRRARRQGGRALG